MTVSIIFTNGSKCLNKDDMYQANRGHNIIVLSYYVFLRSEFRVVMSVTISALERCSVRLYLQLFVGGRYLCLFTYSGVQHILCCVFV